MQRTHTHTHAPGIIKHIKHINSGLSSSAQLGHPGLQKQPLETKNPLPVDILRLRALILQAPVFREGVVEDH